MRHWNAISLGAALLVAASGAALAGPVYTFDWSPGDAGTYSNNGGRINWIQSSFDTNTNRLSWYANFGDASRMKTDGFTLTLRAGSSPKAADGEVAQLYFDSKGAADDLTRTPVLTNYGYNGQIYANSWLDGHATAGVQTPDRISSSASPTATGWVYDVMCVGQADGSRTMGFDIDVSGILGHTPLYPGSGPWTGTGYAEELGVYMQTFAALSTDYSQEYLSQWSSTSKGYVEISNFATGTVTDPVPEPATFALLGLGAIGLFGTRPRRRRRSI